VGHRYLQRDRKDGAEPVRKEPTMVRIAVVIGSTRPSRLGEAVAQWVFEQSRSNGGAEVELVDLKEVGLPLLDEAVVPMMGPGQHPHTKRWSQIVGRFDGYVFVTPEYNHGVPAALKNALDYLYVEWNHKAAGFVSYGSDGGARAVEQLRQVMGQLKVADVAAQVTLSLEADFVDYSEFKPQGYQEVRLHAVFEQVIAWAEALRPLRAA
jgi:NAD(P)H-dependent FMN reductase